MSDRPTEETFPRSRSTNDFNQVRAEIRGIARQLRTMGVGMQADRLEELVVELEPPVFQGVLAGVGQPQHWATPKMVEFMARWLTEAAAIIRELVPDAEITGSFHAIDRARAWLDDHGL